MLWSATREHMLRLRAVVPRPKQLAAGCWFWARIPALLVGRLEPPNSAPRAPGLHTQPFASNRETFGAVHELFALLTTPCAQEGSACQIG